MIYVGNKPSAVDIFLLQQFLLLFFAVFTPITAARVRVGVPQRGGRAHLPARAPAAAHRRQYQGERYHVLNCEFAVVVCFCIVSLCSD